jgi:TolB protein
MRLTHVFTALTGFAALLAAALPQSSAQPQAGSGPAPNPEDILGNMVVVAGATRSLPKIALLPSLASDSEDVTLRQVVRRDLDLCGEFEVLPDSAAPDSLSLSDAPIDFNAWAGKGVSALIRISGKPAGEGRAELKAQAYFMNRTSAPVFDKRYTVPAADLRGESHRVADLLIGALTGQNGGFASRMTFIAQAGKLRRVFTIDADGHDARAISPQEHLALAPTFGKNDKLYYAASVNNGEYRIYTAPGDLVPMAIPGSVYGIAFSKDRSQVALSVAAGDTIKLFIGPEIASVKPAFAIGMALRPTFTPSGKVAFAGAGKYGQRIYVDGKPISPDGLFASAPTFCNHPDGVRAIFAAGVGKGTDLVASGESGGSLVRLTQNQGSNGYPACSPDGRLVAFFSTRKSNEGPGLYIMRIDGLRPKRISSLLGDSLRWDPLPPGKAVEIK